VFSTIGIPGLIIILGIVVLILGPKRLPGIGRSLGTGMREFKDSIAKKSDDDDDDDEEEDDARLTPPPAATTAPSSEPAPVAAKTPAADGDAAGERRL